MGQGISITEESQAHKIDVKNIFQTGIKFSEFLCAKRHFKWVNYSNAAGFLIKTLVFYYNIQNNKKDDKNAKLILLLLKY